MATTAEIIGRRLAEAGCRHAFGIPGGEVLALIDGLRRTGLSFVLSKHENCAGFMAEGVFQRTGAPGVVVATIGPGAANLVNAVANADQDRVPLVVLTGCVDAADALTYTHQVFDHQALFAPFVRGRWRVPETAAAGAVDALIDKALSAALGPRPGPVHIDVPISAAALEQPDAPPVRAAHPPPTAPAPGPQLDEARQWLAEAQRPVMVAGLEVLEHDAADAVRDVVERFTIPLITTYKAKGVVPEDHPLSLGGAGLSPSADRVLLPLIRDADLVLLAGYDPIEMRTGWRSVWDPASQRVVEFSAIPNSHYMHQAGLSFVGHVGAGLQALTSDLSPSSGASDAAIRVRAAQSALATAFRGEEDWGPAAIVETARAALPRDGIATVDSGAHRILLSQVWRAFEPRSLLQSTGLCTMGCALPLAIGVKLVAPERPVIAFTGDAGLEMVLGELATLRDLKLPVAVIVFVDEALELIALKQRSSGLAKTGVEFGGTDFAAVATALGGRGAVARSREELRDHLRAALAADRFTVIACPIPRGSYDGRL